MNETSTRGVNVCRWHEEHQPSERAIEHEGTKPLERAIEPHR